MQDKKHILLVDDDELILRMYADVLRAADFEVDITKSALEALDKLVVNKFRYNLIITDIRMPEMDGWEFLAAIREHMKIDDITLPIIVMSAFDSSEVERKALARQANKWFVKPIKPLSLLVDAARTWTGQQTGDNDKAEQRSGDEA
jgi:CheY-like chemotaxis protein